MKFKTLTEIFEYFNLKDAGCLIWFERRHTVTGSANARYEVLSLPEPIPVDAWTQKHDIAPIIPCNMDEKLFRPSVEVLKVTAQQLYV